MALSQTHNDADIPLIEEHIDTGLTQLLESYKPQYVPGGEVKDELLGRFTFNPARPLPDFDHTFARAYEARDDYNHARQIYAMICEPTIPVRQTAINELTGFVNPHFTALLGAGTVNCSHLGQARHVIFLERPRGTRLSELLKSQGRLHEHRVIDFVLQPAARALLALREKKICHGNITPNNFFLSDSSQLGECFSAPTGTLGHYIYEPLERLMADTLGRGEATEKSDMYSLGILAFELLYGLDKFKAMSREQFIEKVIAMGTYQVFADNREFSDALQDFFRGVFNENPAERWGFEQLAQWSNGKRFNMIAPSTPKEASRPLTFRAENYFSRRLLANSFHRHWREAIKDIRSLKVERWCEMSLHRPELGEMIERALRIAGNAASEAQLNDMMTRIISILDPTGPLRSISVSLRPDALGLLLADAMRGGGTDLGQIINFIENDFGMFWADQTESNRSPEMSQALWRIERVRPFLRNKAVGFGLERALYDLNPSLACQSPLLKDHHVTTALDALRTLDAIAHTLAPNTSFHDQHLAAFLASKIDMGRELKNYDLAAIPALAENQELAVLRLIAKAQQKYQRLELVGLCAWGAMRIEEMLDVIHNRVIRKRLKQQLKRLAASGNMYDVLTAIINSDVSYRDHEGFARAIALHQINNDRMELLTNEAILDYKAKRAGGKMAMIISYIALTITSYITISNVFGI